MAVKSMTGFGRGAGSFGGFDFTIDVKSVNHRFFDFSIRLYKEYSFLEDPIKKRIAELVTRGKIDVYFHVERNKNNSEMMAEIDEKLVDLYLDAANRLEKMSGVCNDLTASKLLTFPDVMKISQPEIEDDEVKNAVLEGLDRAMISFLAMREQEGNKLKEDLLNNLSVIEAAVQVIEKLAPESVHMYRSRLEDKIRELLKDNSIDESRILTEVAIFSDKVAVDEETVRLKSHLSQFKSLLEQGGPIGKKLDFLVQEMNREVNTIGSKCNSIEITKTVVEMKSCIEKIREQIQNIE